MLETREHFQSDKEMGPASPCAVWSKLNCLKSSLLCSRQADRKSLDTGYHYVRSIRITCPATSRWWEGHHWDGLNRRKDDLTSTTKIPNQRKSGSPKSREAHGDGATIVVREWESHLQKVLAS